MRGLVEVARLYAERSVWRPRLLFAAALLALTAIAAASGANSATPEQIADDLVFAFVLPVLALVYGLGVVRDEEGAWHWVLTRGVPRSGVYGVGLACALVLVAALGTGAVSLAGIELGRALRAAALGAGAYVAVFAAMAAALRRPLWPAILLLFLYDLPAARLPVPLHLYTLRAHIENLAIGSPLVDVPLGSMAGPPPTAATSAAVLVAVTAVATALGAVAFARREPLHHGD